jgi:hypothetical protein
VQDRCHHWLNTEILLKLAGERIEYYWVKIFYQKLPLGEEKKKGNLMESITKSTSHGVLLRIR